MDTLGNNTKQKSTGSEEILNRLSILEENLCVAKGLAYKISVIPVPEQISVPTKDPGGSCDLSGELLLRVNRLIRITNEIQESLGAFV